MGSGSPSALCICSVGGARYPITGGNVTGLHEPILDQGLRGVAAKDFGSYKGPFRAEVSLEGSLYGALLGSLASSVIGSGGTLSSSPVRLAAALACGGGGISASDCGVTELTIRFNRAEGAVTYSASMLGWKAIACGPLGALTTEIKPLVGWRTSVSLGGVSGCAVEGEVSLSREWALLYCGNDEYPSNSYAGPLECTARFTVDFSSSGDVGVALNHTIGSVTVGLADADGGGAKSISMPYFYYSDSPVEIDIGGVFATLVFSGRAIYRAGVGPVSIS